MWQEVTDKVHSNDLVVILNIDKVMKNYEHTTTVTVRRTQPNIDRSNYDILRRMATKDHYIRKYLSS